jgi:hypothetical protein
MGNGGGVDCTAALQSFSCLARSITGETEHHLIAMNAPGQARSLTMQS